MSSYDGCRNKVGTDILMMVFVLQGMGEALQATTPRRDKDANMTKRKVRRVLDTLKRSKSHWQAWQGWILLPRYAEP